jgi:5-formyltetrahydrofolate cyclo-ligase
MPDKTSLRKALLEKRRKIPAELRHKKSRLVFNKLFRTSEFRKAEHVALYYGIVGEVGTRAFLKKIMKIKELYLPEAVVSGKKLVFRKFRAFSDLRKNAYAIMEPKRSCPRRSTARMDLIVVPGVGFDRQGGRLGRGDGYYDRALRRLRRVPTIGVCFREQIVKKIPMEARDVRVDKVITD